MKLLTFVATLHFSSSHFHAFAFNSLPDPLHKPFYFFLTPLFIATHKHTLLSLSLLTAMTRLRKLGAVTATAIAAAYGGAVVLHDPLISASDYGGNSRLEALRKKVHDPGAVVPAREAQQSVLAAASKSNPLDVLVIGGGATGSGAALDAVTRGLRVGLVEREDFAAGTSSRSTKLLHGGTLLRMDYDLLILCHAFAVIDRILVAFLLNKFALMNASLFEIESLRC